MDTMFFGEDASLEQKIREMDDRTLLISIYLFVYNLKKDYDDLASSIELDSKTMKQLIGMSERAVCRWRANKTLRYHVRPDGSLYYKFQELYIDVKTGRLSGRNFNRLETLARMKAYFNGRVKRNSNHVDWAYDEDFEI